MAVFCDRSIRITVLFKLSRWWTHDNFALPSVFLVLKTFLPTHFFCNVCLKTPSTVFFTHKLLLRTLVLLNAA